MPGWHRPPTRVQTARDQRYRGEAPLHGFNLDFLMCWAYTVIKILPKAFPVFFFTRVFPPVTEYGCTAAVRILGFGTYYQELYSPIGMAEKGEQLI